MVWRHHLPHGDEGQHVTSQPPRSPGCCSGSDCQAHAQPYAAQQVPPPAGEKEKECRLSFSNKTRQQNGGFSCEYCNCQAHAQLYAAPQVPPPAVEKEKNVGCLSQTVLLDAWRTENKMADFPVSTITARRMRSSMPRSRSFNENSKTNWQLSFEICWLSQPLPAESVGRVLRYNSCVYSEVMRPCSREKVLWSTEKRILENCL